MDDEKYIRDLLSELLQEHAYEAHCANDGMDALEKFTGATYDVVVTDIRMPRLDGFGLLRRLKEGHPNTAVVVMTGYSQEFSIREALLLGAEEYLTKPFHTGEVLMAIERAIWRKRAKQLKESNVSSE